MSEGPDTPYTAHLRSLAATSSSPAASPPIVELMTELVHQKPNQHQVTISADPALTEFLLLRVRSLYSGDIFEGIVAAADVAGLTDPPQLHTLDQLSKLVQEGIRAEAQATDLSTAGPVSCVSMEQQHADPNDKLFLLTFSVSQFLHCFDMTLTLPLKSAAALETRFDLKLAQLEEEFERRVDVLQQQLNLMQLQMNQRVFFGVNHSVHIKCTRLVMADVADVKVGYDLDGFSLQTPQLHKPTPQLLASDVDQLHQKVDQAVIGIATDLFARATERIMTLPSSALTPLQLCRELVHISVTGPEITDLAFLANLPNLTEVTVDNSQVRDLSPLATLPKLSDLKLTNLNLGGGGDVDITCLAHSDTLTYVSFSGSSSVAEIAPLAGIATLKQLDITGCERATDRRAFASNPGVAVIPMYE